MSHPLIRLFEGPAAAAGFRLDLAPLGAPRPLDVLGAELEAAAGKGAQWVVLGPEEPTAHPELVQVLRAADQAGLRAKLTSGGLGLEGKGVLERLRDAGLAQLTILFYGGCAATHDAHVGRPGAFDAAVEAVRVGSSLNRLLVTARMVLLRDNVGEVAELVALLRQAAKRFELVRLAALTDDVALLRAHGVPRPAALAAVQAAWEAARVTHLKLATEAFATWPEVPLPSEVDVQPADLSLLELLRSNVPVPSTTNGTWATPRDGELTGVWYASEASRGLAELGLQLAAYGCPALDLPPPMGGHGLDVPPALRGTDALPLRRRDGVPLLLANGLEGLDTRPLPAWSGPGAGAKVHVVAGWLTDNVLALSTLPALAEGLRARGAEVALHSLWHAPTNPNDDGVRLPDGALGPSTDPARPGHRYPPELVEAFANTPARVAWAKRHREGFVRDLDLSGADLVVVPGFEDGLAVLRHPTLPATARVVIADFHLMSGLGGWHDAFLKRGARPMDGGWWPDERVVVHALYPRYVRAYWRAGVPLRQVLWRPYPVHPGHLGEGPPPASCGTIFAGGSHQRDWRTLAAAFGRLGDRVHPLVVQTPEPVPAPLQSHGEVRLLHFHEAIANSRFVVLPLDPDPRKPAGISVISMALAAGRPIVASATLATVDHLRHGHNAVLVPPNDPVALARAIELLDRDEALLERLAVGARRSAAQLSVDTWAGVLLDGSPAQATWSMEPDPTRGPFYSWPA